jgi:hypothetical protein
MNLKIYSYSRSEVMPVLAACYVEVEGISSVSKTVSSKSIFFPLPTAGKDFIVEKCDVSIMHYQK